MVYDENFEELLLSKESQVVRGLRARDGSRRDETKGSARDSPAPLPFREWGRPKNHTRKDKDNQRIKPQKWLKSLIRKGFFLTNETITL